MPAAVIRNPKNAAALAKAIERMTREWARAETERVFGRFRLEPIFEAGVVQTVEFGANERENFK